MTVLSKRVWFAVILSAVLCCCLVFISPLSLTDVLKLIRPEWGFAAFGFFLLNLVIRGLRLANFSGSDHNVARSVWIHCAARNQFLFSALPSASGDLGFPYIARKLCGIGLAPAAQMIARYRFQDIVALTGILLIGLAFLNGNPALIATTLVVVPVFLFWSEAIMIAVLKLALRAILRIPIVRGFRLFERVQQMLLGASSQEESANRVNRWLSVSWTILSWSLAISAFWCLFMMVGERLALGKILLIVAGLNFFGTINTLTVGGLGVSESALATILISLQYDYETAMSMALVVRPSALIIALSSCLFVELIAYVGPRYTAATKLGRTGIEKGQLS